jgi:CheY-like chemotaxis protein
VPEAIKLLEALATVAWPIIVGLLLWKLFPAIKEIASSRNFSVKIGGAEISVQDATEQIRTQIEDLQEQVILLRAGRASAEMAGVAEREVSPRPAKRSPASRILWVDDKPANNALEIAQMMNEGIVVEQVCSTAEALAALESGAVFGAVISDMGRTEDGHFRREAGLELLEAMRHKQMNQPFMAYTSKRSAPQFDAQVRARGGSGATASPVVLIEWIGEALGR